MTSPWEEAPSVTIELSESSLMDGFSALLWALG
jgi:hypothetical protein